MVNVTPDHANDMLQTQDREDAEVEDGKIEDESLIDLGPMQETTKPKVGFNLDVYRLQG